MTTTIITLLITPNLLSQPANWEQLSTEEQQDPTNQIVENDLIGFG